MAPVPHPPFFVSVSSEFVSSAGIRCLTGEKVQWVSSWGFLSSFLPLKGLSYYFQISAFLFLWALWYLFFQFVRSGSRRVIPSGALGLWG